MELVRATSKEQVKNVVACQVGSTGIKPNLITASKWLDLFDNQQHFTSLNEIYGARAQWVQDRAAVARHALSAFIERFGDLPVRVFRAPGRVNLRGMHVDTHGGYLNLMTHHREILLVTAQSESQETFLANTHPSYAEVRFSIKKEANTIEAMQEWPQILAASVNHKIIRQVCTQDTQLWAKYVIGAGLRVANANPQNALPELKIMVSGDLPTGAALSSSAALCIASLLAWSTWSNQTYDEEQLIRFEQDVEWFAGAWVGMSDQTAILLGQPGQLVNIALFQEDLSLDNASYIAFPEELELLVINSYTTRSLSGAQRVQYVLNRFAYSIALMLLREEMLRSGWTREKVFHADRLSRLTPEFFNGEKYLYQLLMNVPEVLSLDALKSHYDLPEVDELWNRYFGDLPESEQPKSKIPLRGPLLFGLAESERARQFPNLLRNGQFAKAGTLMRVGHDGDRLRQPDGRPFEVDVSDTALSAMAVTQFPLSFCPGKYGASSPALDMLVDAALDAGALGACLTGAGIAGAVLALCRKQDVEHVKAAVLCTLASPEYQHLAGTTKRSHDDLVDAVVINHAVKGAGEFTVT